MDNKRIKCSNNMLAFYFLMASIPIMFGNVWLTQQFNNNTGLLDYPIEPYDYPVPF